MLIGSLTMVVVFLVFSLVTVSSNTVLEDSDSMVREIFGSGDLYPVLYARVERAGACRWGLGKQNCTWCALQDSNRPSARSLRQWRKLSEEARVERAGTCHWG